MGETGPLQRRGARWTPGVVLDDLDFCRYTSGYATSRTRARKSGTGARTSVTVQVTGHDVGDHFYSSDLEMEHEKMNLQDSAS